MVERKFYDKDEFREHLYEFYEKVQAEVPRSIRGRMDAVEGCHDEEGRKVPHCEVVAVQWEQKKRELTLWIEEPGAPDRRGHVFQHDCTAKDQFEECFVNHMRSMADQVHFHDTACHTPGKECKVNKDNAFEP